MNFARVRFDLRAPTQHVQAVYARVPNIGRRRIPEEVPPVVEPIHVERSIRSRPEKEIPVDSFGNGRFLHVSDGSSAFIDGGLHPIWLAELARPHEVHSRPRPGNAPAIQAYLYDALVLPRRLDHPSPFDHGEGTRLLHINVLAGLARPNSMQRVPVVWRCYGDRIEVRVLQHFAQIEVRLRPVPVQLLNLCDALREEPLVNVHQIRNPHARNHKARHRVVDRNQVVDVRIGEKRRLPWRRLASLVVVGAVCALADCGQGAAAAPAASAALCRKLRRFDSGMSPV